ncbi:atypical kinase COQ8B, mitochondrial [Orussus abietinus]|uniref:atypical kinase COQ8B, mitochondrial n=1 Tax=Orussus abietinus TaxID=222816 RepID=UPI000625A276|nr:atypical kinase COQ8B, mitochondrial [Orussus abietinus]XP_012276204.1 atypical kinase COQ8B, mitochondrial [Orussus abietinus]XP_012276213.1 atypical kinase COQ8B, mitochondrial [Orussus abietinus]XP_023289184.1 atypical kinase COQ8B, mitochondrial [Orussus abietinus]
MSRPWLSDFLGVVRGAQTVASAVVKHQEECIRRTVDRSSLKVLAEENLQKMGKKWSNIDPSKVPADLVSEFKETIGRLSVVEKGISQYAKVRSNEVLGVPEKRNYERKVDGTVLRTVNPAKDPVEVSAEDLEEITPRKFSSVKEKIEVITKDEKKVPKIQLSKKEKEILRKLELEHERKMNVKKTTKSTEKNEEKKGTSKVEENPISKPSFKPRQSLSSSARESKVPSTRIQRMVSFGTLGVGLGLGTLAEYTRRTFGLRDLRPGESLDSVFLSKANAERIVSTMCKVRGAALKIGQILSIQDNSIISPELQKAFERVRQSADFMPTWQVHKVLASELGHDWRKKVANFEEKPFAAASIGQVHHATTLDGRSVAMKIQYPGVAQGIQSDIENLVGVMKVWNIFPKGMFIDNLVEVAKKELAWEVDYRREAECSKKYSDLVAPYPEYYVPKVIDELCTKQVFTTELIDGIPVDKCTNMDMETREHIGKLVMKLCLKELFVFQYMQTDPNWSNFFYNPETRQLILLDFGACRSYDKTFMDKYIEIINAASQGDRNKVLVLSREMGFLTGYESKLMEQTHVDAVMILGQVFSGKQNFYDFGAQNVTKRIQTLVPTIIYHRLCPPPEEIYSLNRKLSGVFLLCAKFKIRINCRDMFREIYNNYQFD